MADNKVYLTDDQGLYKIVKTEGTGEETPQPGDTVYVHYVGTLESDGSEFDSSRSRGQPFDFKLGKGNVIKGWDTGVATMRKGEVCDLVCRADYAYGKSGSPPKIPANATLKFEVELLRWVSGEDLSGDGGVVKKELTKGTGWKHPKIGEKVTVNLVTKINNAEVLRESHEATLGDGTLPKGVELVLPKMCEKEVVQIKCTPEYAYGAEGHGPQVPANTPVIFEVELQGWNEIVDVSGDGGIRKEVLVQGQGYETPNANATITVSYQEADADMAVERSVVLGEGGLPDAVEKACEGMKRGERALLTVQPSHHDDGSNTKHYTLELLDFKKGRDTYSMTPSEKLEEALTLKAKGADFFQQGRTLVAFRQYERAAKLVETDSKWTDAALKAQADELRRVVALNQAACCLKLDRLPEVVTSCDLVLKSEPENVKALYRRAVAYGRMSEYSKAKADIQLGLKIDGSNKALRAELAKVNQKIREQDARDKQLFAKIFG